VSLFVPLVRRLQIVDRRIGTRALEPNWAQLEYLEAAERQLRTTGRIRLIVLKARQLGISTISEALLFWLCFIIPRYKSLVVTHEIKASQHLLSMTQLYWESFPYAPLYSTRFLSRNDIHWRETGSSIRIDTTGRKTEVGRSNTIHGLHGSEVAFWDNPELIMLGLRQAIPPAFGTAIILESTANGRGNWFHQTWLDAEASSDSEYEPLFFPWYRHYENYASYHHIEHSTLTNLDPEEKVLQRIGITDDQLTWRRWAIRNLCNNSLIQFMQEYPSTPEEAFIASGTNVFPYRDLFACYQPENGVKGELVRAGNDVTFQPSDTGRLTIFRQVDELNSEYLVTGDPTRILKDPAKRVGGDPACAQVINRRTMEQIAVWRGKIDAGTFAEELFKLGLFFNTALVSCEFEKVGGFTIGKLQGLNYPRIYLQSNMRHMGHITSAQHGWHTTAASKPQMIAALQKFIVDHDITVHDRTTFAELQDYVTDEQGGYGPADTLNGHDDTVMALAQAVIIHVLEGAVMPFETVTTPRAKHAQDIVELLERNNGPVGA
jgi:hypothetical protein